MAEPEVHDLDHLMRICGVSVTDASARAGIAESNFRRWRNQGVSPNMGRFNKLKSAVVQLAVEQDKLPEGCQHKVVPELIELAKGWRV